jgi:hypothetical protein
MRTIETKKMVLAVLTATIVLTLASVSYIEPAAAHHGLAGNSGEPHTQDDEDGVDDEEVLEEIKEAQDKADEKAEEE